MDLPSSVIPLYRKNKTRKCCIMYFKSSSLGIFSSIRLYNWWFMDCSRKEAESHFISGWNLISKLFHQFLKTFHNCHLVRANSILHSRLPDRLKNNRPIYQIHKMPCLQIASHDPPTILSQSYHDPPTTLLWSFNNWFYKQSSQRFSNDPPMIP